MNGEGELDPEPGVDSAGTDKMLMLFLALYFLLGAVLFTTAAGFFPLSSLSLRLLLACAREDAARWQAPPGRVSVPWRGSPAPSSLSLV